MKKKTNKLRDIKQTQDLLSNHTILKRKKNQISTVNYESKETRFHLYRKCIVY